MKPDIILENNIDKEQLIKYQNKLDNIIIKCENNNITGSYIWIIYKECNKNN